MLLEAMGGLPGTSEITESTEDLNPATDKQYCMKDDINKLFEAIEIRTSRRGVSKSEQGVKDAFNKSAMKRPMRSSPSRASGFDNSEPASLKQAFRGLCISQASELAAVKKRSSKASRLSGVSETGAVKNLFRPVVVQSSGPEHIVNEGVGNLVEISLIPDSSMSNTSDNIAEYEHVPTKEKSTYAACSFHLSKDAMEHGTEISDISDGKEACPHSTDIGSGYLKEVSERKLFLELPHSSTATSANKVETQTVSTSDEAPPTAIPSDKEQALDSDLVSCSSISITGNKVTRPTSSSPSLMRPFSRSRTFVKRNVISALTSSSKQPNGGIDNYLSCSISEIPCQTPENVLHMLGVIYRDLKPENVLVREDGHIMLSDFDLSLRCVVNPMLVKSYSPVIKPPKTSSPCSESSCIDPFCLHPSWQVSCFTPRFLSAAAKTRKLKADIAAQVTPLPQLVVEPTDARSNSFVGTHEYLAPEIIKGEGHGSAVDWWTFGVFLYELLYGRTPFKGPGNEDTLANVVSQCLKFPAYPVVSSSARDLIRRLLQKEPENRLGAEKGAAEIKQHPFFEGLNWALIRCETPPELPRFCDLGNVIPDTNQQTKEIVKSQKEFKSIGEDIEFEMF